MSNGKNRYRRNNRNNKKNRWIRKSSFPKEFRNTLGLKEKDEVEIFLLKDGFYVKKV